MDAFLLDQLSQPEHSLIGAVRGYAEPMTGLPSKLGAIRAATRALIAGSVPHALIGGLAVGIRSGVPRATLDVDFAVPSNSDKHGLAALLTEAEFAFVGQFPRSITSST